MPSLADCERAPVTMRDLLSLLSSERTTAFNEREVPTAFNSIWAFPIAVRSKSAKLIFVTKILASVLTVEQVLFGSCVTGNKAPLRRPSTAATGLILPVA